jgi:hypothetical protein
MSAFGKFLVLMLDVVGYRLACRGSSLFRGVRMVEQAELPRY